LNFNDMTRGFLPNLEMNLAKCNVLISSWSAASGVKPGVYIYLTKDIFSSPWTVYLTFFDQFASILSIFGVRKLPSMTIDVTLGIVIQSTSELIGVSIWQVLRPSECL
jgi:hypothetical protein